MMDRTSNVPIVLGTVTNCDELRLRREPNFDSEVITTIDVGTKLKLIPESDDWYKVIKFKGITGYVYANYIIQQPSSQK